MEVFAVMAGRPRLSFAYLVFVNPALGVATTAVAPTIVVALMTAAVLDDANVRCRSWWTLRPR